MHIIYCFTEQCAWFDFNKYQVLCLSRAYNKKSDFYYFRKMFLEKEKVGNKEKVHVHTIQFHISQTPKSTAKIQDNQPASASTGPRGMSGSGGKSSAAGGSTWVTGISLSLSGPVSLSPASTFSF